MKQNQTSTIRVKRLLVLTMCSIACALCQEYSPFPISQAFAVSTFNVTTTSDSGAGSLRQAILDANGSSGTDTITFNIPGSGVQTISPASPLPTITDAVVIDGTTQPGFAGSPIIELNGDSAGAANGLVITSGNSSVRGLVINRFSGHGILLQTNGNNTIEGNYIGTNAAGTVALPVGFSGVVIEHSHNNTIGGTTSGSRNLISGNSQPNVHIDGANGNVVQGNYIGTDATGDVALGGNGIFIFAGASNNLIGGTIPEARNVLSGNRFAGIDITNTGGVGATGNVVQGNYIGTNATGTAALGNNGDGVALSGVSGNIIGGAQAGARNIIAGNGGNGIRIYSFTPNQQVPPVASTNNLVQGNFIGTNAAGLAALANNGAGINLNSASDNTIGGTSAGSRNIISGNGGAGILIGDSGTFDPTGSTGNVVQGNFIGTDVNGMTALSNAAGVSVAGASNNNLVGGTTNGAGNVIAYNRGAGVTINSATGNAILSNSIFSNDGLGIQLFSGNNNQSAPTLTGVSNFIKSINVEGWLNGPPNTSYTVQFFSNADCDPSGAGEGQDLLGSTTAVTDGSGIANFSVTLSTKVQEGQFITLTATDQANNTSQFSQCASVPAALRAPTATTVVSSASPSLYGNFVTFTAIVSSIGGTPDGRVEFFDGSISLGSAFLNGGTTSLTTPALNVGSHSIVAVYGQTRDFLGSTSLVLIQTVGMSPTTTTLRVLKDQVNFFQPVQFRVEVSAPPGVGLSPDGIVQVRVRRVSGGPCTPFAGCSSQYNLSLDKSGKGSFNVIIQVFGDWEAQAFYLGSSSFISSQSQVVPFSIR